MFSLVFYVPRSYKERVKEALFKAGAGSLGDYGECCWETRGRGQFLPLNKSHPYLGKIGKKHYVREYRVEMVVADELLAQTVEALLNSHPYEVPAYHYFPVNLENHPRKN